MVLTESEKFAKHGVVPLNLKNQIQAVITDSHIDSISVAELETKNFKLLLFNALNMNCARYNCSANINSRKLRFGKFLYLFSLLH